jgi:hypothetical protein
MLLDRCDGDEARLPEGLGRKWLTTSWGFFGDKGERLLTIIANIVIIISLCAYVLKEFIWPYIRRTLLQSPVKAFFIITSLDRFELKYAIQDENEHRLLAGRDEPLIDQSPCGRPSEKPFQKTE